MSVLVKEDNKRNVYVVTGPSGAGKTTVVSKILELMEGRVGRVVTTTTRPSRPGEVDGEDYYFVSKKEFDGKIISGKMFEWKEVYGNYYGSTITEVENQGTSTILTIDVKGAESLSDRENVVTIFLRPAILDSLEKRLRKRGEISDVIERRMSEVSKEMEFESKADHVVINKEGDPSRAVNAIINLITIGDSLYRVGVDHGSDA
jgi:guanylate kinase